MLLYIAGCYAPKDGRTVDDHIELAKEASIAIWKTGNYALCPHMNTAHLDDEIDNPELFYAGTMEVLRRCDGIVMLENWEESQGAIAELAYAQDAGMPIWCYPDLPTGPHITEQRSPVQAKAFMETIMEMYRVHLDKNADYSPANILGTGELGLMTRFWDKTSRLMNLYGFRLEIKQAEYTAPRQPKNESVQDSWMDAAVYAIIAILLRQGKWGR
jgi:hypothetical protein